MADSRLLSVVAVCLISTLLVVTTVKAQSPDPPRNPLRTVEDKARQSHKLNQGSRQFVDELFDTTLLRGAPESVRARLTKAEDLFRAHSRAPIRESDVADVVNRLVNDFSLPTHMRTNAAQLRKFRQLMSVMTPSAIGSTSKDEMSPAETILVAMHLGFQKLTNADYAMEPDAWVRSLERSNGLHKGWNGTANPRPERPVLLTRVISQNTVDILEALSSADKSESTDLAYGLHLFLDSLGIER